MLKSFIGIYLDFICNFYCIKNIACFQKKIIFASKKCSPCSKNSNQTGKICFIFFGFYLFFYEFFLAERFKKKPQIGLFLRFCYFVSVHRLVRFNERVRRIFSVNERPFFNRSSVFLFRRIFPRLSQISISDRIFVSV